VLSTSQKVPMRSARDRFINDIVMFSQDKQRVGFDRRAVPGASAGLGARQCKRKRQGTPWEDGGWIAFLAEDPTEPATCPAFRSGAGSVDLSGLGPPRLAAAGRGPLAP
jgi:hypothetical protein